MRHWQPPSDTPRKLNGNSESYRLMIAIVYEVIQAQKSLKAFADSVMTRSFIVGSIISKSEILPFIYKYIFILFDEQKCLLLSFFLLSVLCFVLLVVVFCLSSLLFLFVLFCFVFLFCFRWGGGEGGGAYENLQYCRRGTMIPNR